MSERMNYLPLLEDLKTKRTLLEGQIRAINAAIAALEGLYRDNGTPLSIRSGRFSGMKIDEIVRLILRESPKSLFTADVARLALDGGWLTRASRPDRITYAALWRWSKEDGGCVNGPQGWYIPQTHAISLT